MVMEPFDTAWLQSMPVPARTWLRNAAVATTQALELQAAHWRALQAILDDSVPTCVEHQPDDDGDHAAVAEQPASEPDQVMVDADRELLPDLATAGGVPQQEPPPDAVPDQLTFLTLDRPLFRREKVGSGKTGGRAHLDRFATTATSSRGRYSCPAPSLTSLMQEMAQRRRATRKDGTTHVVEGESVVKPPGRDMGETSEGETLLGDGGRKQSDDTTSGKPERDRTELETEQSAMQEEGQHTPQRSEPGARTSCKPSSGVTKPKSASSPSAAGSCARCGCTCFENNHYSQGRCMNCFHKHEIAA